MTTNDLRVKAVGEGCQSRHDPAWLANPVCAQGRAGELRCHRQFRRREFLRP
ncbi:MAG: hypothetical protein R3D43_05690 [Tepidamorphaceae bacterium]